MSTTSRRTRKLSNAFTALFALGVLVYVMWTGLSFLAHRLAPGVWGYIGAAGYVALIAPVPWLLLAHGFRHFAQHWGPLMLTGAATIVVAIVAGKFGWPEWAAYVWLATPVAALLVLRTVASTRTRLTTRSAVLLRQERPTAQGDDRWSNEDWDWAFARTGTSTALQQVAWHRRLKGRGSPHV